MLKQESQRVSRSRIGKFNHLSNDILMEKSRIIRPCIMGEFENGLRKQTNMYSKKLSAGNSRRQIDTNWGRSSNQNKAMKPNGLRTVEGSVTSLASTSFHEMNFELFDPFRSLQFLILELNENLKILIPEEKNILKIVKEIKYNLKRLATSAGIELSSLFTNIDKVSKLDQYCQTVPDWSTSTMCIQTDKLPNCSTNTCGCGDQQQNVHKDIVENYKKLESEYNNLQQNLKSLINENEMYLKEQSALKAENKKLCDENYKLQSRVIEVQQNSQASLHSFEERYSALKMEFKLIEDNFRDIQQKNSLVTKELTNTITNYESKISNYKQSLKKQEQELIFLKLEKEKLAILLRCREDQNHEMENEIKLVHKVTKNALNCINNSFERPKYTKHYKKYVSKIQNLIKNKSRKDRISENSISWPISQQNSESNILRELYIAKGKFIAPSNFNLTEPTNSIASTLAGNGKTKIDGNHHNTSTVMATTTETTTDFSPSTGSTNS